MGVLYQSESAHVRLFHLILPLHAFRTHTYQRGTLISVQLISRSMRVRERADEGGKPVEVKEIYTARVALVCQGPGGGGKNTYYLSSRLLSSPLLHPNQEEGFK